MSTSTVHNDDEHVSRDSRTATTEETLSEDTETKNVVADGKKGYPAEPTPVEGLSIISTVVLSDADSSVI